MYHISEPSQNVEKIFIGHYAVEKCKEFAEKVCKSYEDGRKNESLRLMIPDKPPIDKNRHIQYIARLAEYATCLFLHIDPNKSLNWSSKCDNGYDLIYMGKTIDVKASGHPEAHRLIWPVTKKHFLHKAADYLVLARVPPNKSEALGQTVELLGCITRERFIKEAVTAFKLKGIVDGTPYVDQKNLDKVANIMQTLHKRST